MLVAVSSTGQRQVASAQVRGESFTCPDCHQPLLVRIPKSRVPHFAHTAGQRCVAQLNRAARRAAARRAATARRLRAKSEQMETQGQQSLFELSDAG